MTLPRPSQTLDDLLDELFERGPLPDVIELESVATFADGSVLAFAEAGAAMSAGVALGSEGPLFPGARVELFVVTPCGRCLLIRGAVEASTDLNHRGGSGAGSGSSDDRTASAGRPRQDRSAVAARRSVAPSSRT